jgi:hypothetical protein
MPYKIFLLCSKKGCMELVQVSKDTEQNVLCDKCQKKSKNKKKK